LHEWRFNMKTGEVKSKALDRDYYCDFPRIHDDLVGKKSRYLYASRFRIADATFDGEMKYDNETGEIQTHYFGDNKESGEAIFAPRIDAVDEDDGYVICFVYDKIEESSECHIIDAKRFEDEPVARIKIPQRVPHGFHASWVAG
jgi:carotenoid cleavage dioxygenase-like enzyme